MANAPKLQNGLTIQQNNFKGVILEQLNTAGKINGTQAALQTYNTTDLKTAQNIGTENLAKPIIQEAIEKALVENGLTPVKITKNLGHYANNLTEKVSAEASIKANIEILKLMGAYPGSKHARLNVNVKAKWSDLKFQEIKQKVQEIDQELKETIDE